MTSGSIAFKTWDNPMKAKKVVRFVKQELMLHVTTEE